MAETRGEQDRPNETQVLENRVRELRTLHEIARAVTSVLDLESVLNRIVEAAVYLTNAEEGFLLLVEKASNGLTLRAGKGLGEKASTVRNMKVTDTIAGQVVETGRPVRMGGFQRDEEFKVKTGYLVKSLVNVPIKSAGQVIGVLSVDHSLQSMRSFSDHDVVLLSSLADYAAIALQNAQLYADASTRAEKLAQALEEQTGVAPPAPTPEEDRHELERFVQGLRAQREEVLRGIESTRQMAKDLQIQADSAEEVSRRLGLWDEEVLGLLPQLEWLVQAGLPQAAERPVSLPEAPASTDEDTLPTPTIGDSQILQHLAEGALLCDAQGLIRQANHTAAQILEKPVNELVNANLHAVVDDPRWERIVSSLRLAMTMGSAGQSGPPAPETTLCIRDHIIHAKLIPIYDSQTGAATIIATFLRDISAETEGWRARDEVLAALSKRMRSPMTAIASYSDLLLGDKMGVADSMQRRYLQRIRTAIEQLETALNELGQGTPSSDLRMTPVPTHPVIEVINQAVDAAQNVLSLEGVNIVRDIDDELPLVQVADAEYVVRTLADLLLAVGARTSFGDNVQVSTQVEQQDEKSRHLILALKSKDAPGRELAPLEEDESISATIALAEDAGGRIWVERESDGGNRICFLLPAAISESPD